MRPSPELLLEETARLAHHFHWPLDVILDLEHADRRAFLATAQDLAGESAQVEAEEFDDILIEDVFE